MPAAQTKTHTNDVVRTRSFFFLKANSPIRVTPFISGVRLLNVSYFIIIGYFVLALVIVFNLCGLCFLTVCLPSVNQTNLLVLNDVTLEIDATSVNNVMGCFAALL